MNAVDEIERAQMKKKVPSFCVGDTVKVHMTIKEGDKERVQVFEGVVIARKHGGVRETFTVRKISFGVGVERVFPIHSPKVGKIEVARHGRVRRAKLYYLRDLKGKASKTKEKSRQQIQKAKQGADAGAPEIAAASA